MRRWRSGLEICANGRVEGVAVDALEQAADRGRVRRRPDAGERVGREAEDPQDGLRGVRYPFTDRDEGAGAGQDCGGGRTKQREHGIPPSPHAAWIGHPDQKATQVGGILLGDTEVREGQLPQPGGHGR